MSGSKSYEIRYVLSTNFSRAGMGERSHEFLCREEPSATNQSRNLGMELLELQSLQLHYALTDEQLWHAIQRALASTPSAWMDNLIGLLERRLDNVVYRLEFAQTIAGARKLITHGYILVNGRMQTVASTILRPGEIICVTTGARSWADESSAESSLGSRLPGYLQFQNPMTRDRAIVLSIPDARHLPIELKKRVDSDAPRL